MHDQSALCAAILDGLTGPKAQAAADTVTVAVVFSKIPGPGCIPAKRRWREDHGLRTSATLLPGTSLQPVPRS